MTIKWLSLKKYINIDDDLAEYYAIFTLEEFLEKYPYKVGDEVYIDIQSDDIGGWFDIEVAEEICNNFRKAMEE